MDTNSAKSDKRYTSINIVKGLYLQDAAVEKIEAKRLIPQNEALSGSFSSLIDLEISPGIQNKVNGITAIITVVTIGRKVDSPEQPFEEREVAYKVDLSLNGFFIVEGHPQVIDSNLMDKKVANAVVDYLYPVAVSYINQLLTSMGYSRAVLKYGIGKVKIASIK